MSVRLLLCRTLQHLRSVTLKKAADGQPLGTLLHQLQAALRELDEAGQLVAAAHLAQVIDVLEGSIDQIR